MIPMRAAWIGVIAALFGGCGGGGSGGGPDQAAPADAAVRPDLAGADQSPPADQAAPLDQAGPADLTLPPDDAQPGDVTGSLGSPTIFESCMPIVAADPITISATLTLTNNGNVPVGPIAIATGSGEQMQVTLTSFTIQPMQTAVLMPGQKAMLQVDKVAGSAMPANHCQTLPCGGGVNLVVPYAGPGVANGSRAVSALTQVSCAF